MAKSRAAKSKGPARGYANRALEKPWRYGEYRRPAASGWIRHEACWRCQSVPRLVVKTHAAWNLDLAFKSAGRFFGHASDDKILQPLAGHDEIGLQFQHFFVVVIGLLVAAHHLLGDSA